jgi:KDO2-lipid IV(A) lauroyltransferase
MNLQEAWDNFPTANLFDDTLRMNAELAEHIRATPSQYYWVHKRFKTRPEGEASVYKNAAI